MSDCISTLPDIKLFNNYCDCPPLCSDEREGFSSTDLSSTDLSSIDLSSTDLSTITTISNKTVAAAIRSLITDISVDVTTTKVIKD